MAGNFNKEILDYLNGLDRGYGGELKLPDNIALSVFGSQLKNIMSQLNQSNLSDEKKIQALREVQRKREENWSKLEYKQKKELLKQQEKDIKARREELKEAKELQKAAEKLGDEGWAKELQQTIDNLQAAIDENYKKTSEDLKKERKSVKKGSDQYKELTQAIKDAKKEERTSRIEDSLQGTKSAIEKKLGIKDDNDYTTKDKAGQAISASIEKLAAVADKAFSQAEEILTQYNAKISARLEGSGKQYTDLSNVIKKNLSASTVVKQTDVLNNLARLVDSGIAYNLEQRAFIASVKDDIAATFDAFDSNLAQMIRLQRTDSTMARMGLESALQSFFNENFLDTSYLTDLRKSVSGALIDVESTMVNEEATDIFNGC